MSATGELPRSRPILLDGPPGVGKSTLGPALAEATGRRFVDLDDRVASEASAACVAELFAREGEAGFRARERACLLRLLHGAAGPALSARDAGAQEAHASGDERALVIALGGGTLVDPTLRSEALAHAVVVGLTVPRSVLLERLRSSARARPLLRDDASAHTLDPAAPPPFDVDEARLDDLLERRRSAYERVHLRVDASRSTSELCAELSQLTDEAPVPVGGFERPHLVRITRDPAAALASSLRALAPSSFAFVTDSNVAPLHAASLLARLAAEGFAPCATITLPPGEQHKSFDTLRGVLEQLGAAKLDRSSAVVAMGGGVVSDLAGFAASVYMRGVAWIAVPTTLLAQVDASVGGKTAVDLLGAKNLVGAFHPPQAVIVHPDFVRTETERAQRSALAEVVKIAAICDVDLFERCERASLASIVGDPALLEALVRRSIEAKRSIVERDPTERAERMWLNLGHTFGHALESAGGFERYTHGECVAAGMLVALALGTLGGRTAAGALERVRGVLLCLGCLPTLGRSEFRGCIEYLSADKKLRGGKLWLVELERIGCARVQPWALHELESCLDAALDRIEIFPR